MSSRLPAMPTLQDKDVKFVGKDAEPKVGMRVKMAPNLRQHGLGTIYDIGKGDVGGMLPNMLEPCCLTVEAVAWDGGRMDRVLVSGVQNGELSLVTANIDSTYSRTRSHTSADKAPTNNKALSSLAEELQDDLERVEEKTALLRAAEIEVGGNMEEVET